MYMPERDFSLKTYALFILMAGSLLAVMAFNMPVPGSISAYLDGRAAVIAGGSGLRAAEVPAELPMYKEPPIKASLIDEHTHGQGDTIYTHTHGQGDTIYTHTHALSMHHDQVSFR